MVAVVVVVLMMLVMVMVMMKGMDLTAVLHEHAFAESFV